MEKESAFKKSFIRNMAWVTWIFPFFIAMFVLLWPVGINPVGRWAIIVLVFGIFIIKVLITIIDLMFGTNRSFTDVIETEKKVFWELYAGGTILFAMILAGIGLINVLEGNLSGLKLSIPCLCIIGILVYYYLKNKNESCYNVDMEEVDLYCLLLNQEHTEKCEKGDL